MRKLLTLRIFITLLALIFSGVAASMPNSCSSTLNAAGIKIDNGGSNSQINNTTEALSIYAAWLAAGSPATGLISGGIYNVAASGANKVDRIDFGGSGHDFSGTLPYPGAGVSGSDFLVHTSGTITLAAGNYTIFVESDDGFSFTMNTVSGDTVSFNKFGNSTSGSSNELRYENPTSNSNTGGSFTLTQESVFDIAAIFFERGGGDYLEISISDDLRTNAAPSGYEILRDGALSNKVKFGNCASTPSLTPLAEYRLDELSWNSTANEVSDNSGNNYHGQSFGMTTSLNGKVCGAGDFTTTGTGDYLSLANSAVNGLNDFTVSVWAKTDGLNTATILSGANAGQRNEMIMFFSGTNLFMPHIKGSRATLNNGGIGDDDWHHLAWTRVGTNHCYYVDGDLVQCGSGGGSGALNIASGGLIIGQEQDSLGGSFDTDQAWDGLLDELIIFDSALSASQIDNIYDNQDAGKNYDGSARICPVPVIPLLEYRFEQNQWNGTAGEILDETGNGHHARVNNNSIPETSSPALMGNPGSCGYASQNDGAIEVTGLPLDTSTIGVKTTVTFWMNWDGTNSAMPIGWRVHDIWIFNGDMGFNTGNGDIYGISSAGLANGWHHVAVEFTNGSVTNNRMYIDGVERVLTQRRSTPNNSRAFVDSELRVGGWSINANYDFHGFIDEVRVYEGALTSSQVNTIMAERHPCPSIPVAEYRLDELSWDGTADEVFDNSGNNHHGVAFGMTTLPSGKICAAGDFTATGTSDYLSLANTAVDGLNDFTVSVWAKTNGLNTATILSGANAGQKNEMIMFYKGTNLFMPHVKGANASINNGAIGDDDWHHLVWTRVGNSQCYYVDGALVQCRNGGNSGALNIDPSGLIVGQEQDIVGGSFDASQAWDGLLDELIIFDSALPSSEITKIYNNQNTGKNYNGSARICPVPAIPLLEYRFEETNWNGTAGEIIDSTGNGHHARVHNNSIPVTTSPALTGDPGSCGYASQNDGSIEVTGLPLDTSTIGVKTTVTFWMNWDGTDNAMPIGWNYHDIWLRSGSMGFNTFNSDIYGISSAGLANGWHHVAVEFTNGSVDSNRMHIDGVEQVLTQRRGTPRNNRAFVNSQLRVGGVANSDLYDFHGLLDEVRVYQGSLTTNQVNDIMAERHPCSVSIVHHYEISHDGHGLTCDAESVTIKACTNASCSNLSTQPVTLDLLANGNLISAPTFTGSTTVNFNHTVVETLTLSVANATLAASNPIVCDDGSGTSCNIAFANAGFRFLYGDPNNNVTAIPNQTSGAVFADSLHLQAVKNSNGVCTGLFTGNKNIDLWQENVDPGGTSGLNFTVGGNAIDKQSGGPSTTLNFGPNSIATIPSPIYHDAGKIRLHANYNVGGISLTGSSNNSFWVSPEKLVVTAMSVPPITPTNVPLTANTATATPTHKAGEKFELKVSAYNAATPSVETPNYSPGQIQFKLERTGPTLVGSVDGEFSYAAGPTLTTSTTPTFTNVTLSSFIAGISTYGDAQYSEVGLLNLAVRDRDYGNVGIEITAASIDIGRFIPHHFEVELVQNGSFMATCNTGTTFFAYSGQTDEANQSIGAISYLTNPVFEITAYNKQGSGVNGITRNYFEDSQNSANDYMKLNSSTDINITAPTLDEDAVGVDTNKLPLTANLNTGTLSQNDLTVLPNVVALPKGVLHYQLSDSDNFFYNRSANAKVTPFPAEVKISTGIIKDPEGVEANNTAEVTLSGVEIRFGRLVLENSYGPETSNIPQPMQIEHFDGTDFIVSSDNNCVSYDASKVLLSNISLNPSLTSALGGTGSFVNGKTQKIELKATGAGNQGQLEVKYNIFDWLKYDWDNSGTHNQNPTAIATFGLFRGNDRVIYWREVAN